MNLSTEFIQVGELAASFAPNSHRLTPLEITADLHVQLNFTDKRQQLIHFKKGYQLDWEGETAPYRATAIREHIVFIDFIDPKNPRASISLIFNKAAGHFTAIFGRLPMRHTVNLSAFNRIEANLELTAVEVDIHFGWLNKQSGTLAEFSRELIGLRNLYTYSATERYEHVYLNEQYYAWHCLNGVEKGLADVDRCHYFKIDDELYLLIWREKIIPTLGIVLIDLKNHRTDGKLMGYRDNDFNEITNFAVGAHAQVLNSTRYPPIDN